MALMSVVLPAPLGPNSPTDSSPTVMLTLRSTGSLP